MRHRLQAQGQYAAGHPPAPTKSQVMRSAVCCPQQHMLQHVRVLHSGCSQTVAKCNKQGCHESIAVWPAQLQCYDNAAATATTAEHVPQQPFPASSGMHSTLLNTQQQQVTQLLHARTQQALRCPPLQLQQRPNRPVEQMQHNRQHDGNQLCLSQAAAATVIQQRCDDVAYSQERGREKLQQQLYSQAPPLHQQLDSIQQPPGEVEQHQPSHSFQQHQRVQDVRINSVQQQEDQQQQHDRQQRLLAAEHPAQYTGWIKHSNTVLELQQLHQAHSSRFNYINIAAMLVKLAKLACADATTGQGTASSSSSSSSLQDVRHFALQLAQQLMLRLHECSTARQIANASWALAVLQCDVPSGLLQHAAQQVTAQGDRLLTASQPQELAMLSWGLAKLQHDPTCTLWPQLMAVVQKQLHQFNPQEITMLMWSVANVQQRQQQRWRAGAAVAAVGTPGRGSSGAAGAFVQQQAQQQAGTAEGLLQRLRSDRRNSNTTASASAAAAPDRPCFGSAAGRSGSMQSSSSGQSAAVPSRSSTSSSRQQEGLLQQQLQQQLLPAVCSTVLQQLQQGAQNYKAKELSLLLWSCAVLNCRDSQLLHAIGDQLQQHLRDGSCNSQDVSTSIWALGKLHNQHLHLLAAAAATTPSWLHQCSSQNLSLVLYGCAAALQPGRCKEADGQAAAAVQLWQVCAEEIQRRLLIDEAGSWGLAQCATLLQAVALVLQPPERLRNRQRQQQQRQRQQQQQQRQRQQQDSTREPVVGSSSSIGSFSSFSSMSGSWDGEDSSTADIARQLTSIVDSHLNSMQLGSGTSRCSGSSQQQYVPCILSAFAAAAVPPSQELRTALLAAAQTAAPGMNRQQLCMTAWAAAKLAPIPGSPTRVADEATAQLMEVLEGVAVSKLSGMQPQQLSVLAWAHARLWNLGDSLLMHELSRAALRALPRFGPQALSNLTWAFARARHYDGAFATALARRAKALVAQFSPAELANLVWGLVTLRCRQLGLLTAVAGHVSEHCSSWDVKACTKLAVAFASDDMPVYRFKSMFWALSEALVGKPRGLASLTMHELSQLAGALAVARVRHKGLAGHIAALAVQQLDNMSLCDVVHLVWALACLNHRHDALLNAVSARVAREMGGKLVSPIKCAEECSSNSSTTTTTNDSYSSSSSSSLFCGKLLPQYLPRLAWAYKTLQHEDACWYMGAARLAAGMEHSSSGSSTSSGLDSSSPSDSNNGTGRGARLRAMPMQLPGGVRAAQRGTGPMQHHNGNSSSWPGRTQHIGRPHGAAGNRHAPGTGSSSSSGRGVRGSPVFPAVLQRPLYQEPVPGVEREVERKLVHTPPQEQ